MHCFYCLIFSAPSFTPVLQYLSIVILCVATVTPPEPRLRYKGGSPKPGDTHEANSSQCSDSGGDGGACLGGRSAGARDEGTPDGPDDELDRLLSRRRRRLRYVGPERHQ